MASIIGRLLPMGIHEAGYLAPCFIIINVYDLNVRGMIMRFADDTKIGHVIDSEEKAFYKNN